MPRFAIGTHVVCRMDHHDFIWERGHVIKLDHQLSKKDMKEMKGMKQRRPFLAPYVVLLDNTELCYCPLDDDRYIRKDAFHSILQHYSDDERIYIQNSLNSKIYKWDIHGWTEAIVKMLLPPEVKRIQTAGYTASTSAILLLKEKGTQNYAYVFKEDFDELLVTSSIPKYRFSVGTRVQIHVCNGEWQSGVIKYMHAPPKTFGVEWDEFVPYIVKCDDGKTRSVVCDDDRIRLEDTLPIHAIGKYAEERISTRKMKAHQAKLRRMKATTMWPKCMDSAWVKSVSVCS